MFRITSALLLATVFLSSVPIIGFLDWTAVAVRTLPSVVTIEREGGFCTGMVIDVNRRHVLSAAHCDGPNLYVDHSSATVIAKDSQRDLLVLKVDDLGTRPALKLAAHDPQVGAEVLSIGYGYALEAPMVRSTRISAVTRIPELRGQEFLLTQEPFVGGQSGGPLLNHDGEIAGIVQASSPQVGLATAASEIRKRVGRYFGP